MKRYYVGALTAAIILNVLFFAVIGWAWYKSVHHRTVKTKAPANVTTHIVSENPQQAYTLSAQQLVQKTFAGQAVLHKTFAGPGNLQGLVLSLKNQPTQTFIAYFDPAQKLLYLGSVINKQGKNTTIAATQKYLTDPAKPIILNKVSQLPAIITGDKSPAHTITVMVDPNAPLFAKIYHYFLVDEVQNHLKVRWILVNYLKPMGPNLAGYILMSQNPAKTLATIAAQSPQYWQNLKVHKLPQNVLLQLRHNWNVMQNYHLVPGPVTIFKTLQHVYVLKGFVDPESFDQILPQIVL